MSFEDTRNRGKFSGYSRLNDPREKALREIAPYARILTPSPALTTVRGQIVADAVNQVLLGQLTPEAGVKKMKADADKAIRETQ